MGKIRAFGEKLVSEYKNFGFGFAFSYRVVGRLKGKMHKNEVVTSYLKKQLAPVIEKYSGYNEVPSTIAEDAPIWVCWWQGEQNMPPIVAACYRSLKRHAGTHPVNLITFENLNDYITFPSYIIEKQKEGKITLTHLSDILRFSLLAKYGGLWIDSTVFVTGDLNLTGKKFFTVKCNRPDDGYYMSKYRWTGFCIGGDRSNVLFHAVRDMLFAYWDCKDRLIEYLIVDYLIDIMYQENHIVKDMVDSNPLNNEKLDELFHYMNDTYNDEMFRKLCESTCLHKLSWKEEYEEKDVDGRETLYSRLVKIKNE